MLPPCFYRVSTKALIAQAGKIVLVMEPDGRWELPGGGLEVGESFTSGLTREIKEELGVNISKVSPKPVYVWTLVDRDPVKGAIPKLVLAFKTSVDSLNFVYNPEESSQIDFFTPEEIKKLNLHPNIQNLAHVLDLKDLD